VPPPKKNQIYFFELQFQIFFQFSEIEGDTDLYDLSKSDVAPVQGGSQCQRNSEKVGVEKIFGIPYLKNRKWAWSSDIIWNQLSSSTKNESMELVVSNDDDIDAKMRFL